MIHDPSLSPFAKVLREERLKMRMTMEEASCLLEVDLKTLSNWELDKTRILKVTQEGALARLYAEQMRRESVVDTLSTT